MFAEQKKRYNGNQISGCTEPGHPATGILGSTVMPPGRITERQSDARANAAGSPDVRGNVSDPAGTEGTGHRKIERARAKDENINRRS